MCVIYMSEMVDWLVGGWQLLCMTLYASGVERANVTHMAGRAIAAERSEQH